MSTGRTHHQGEVSNESLRHSSDMPLKSPPIDYIARTRAQYDALGYPPYRWVTSTEPPPFAPLRKPVRESRLALIGSGGIYARGQIAFHFKDDTSFRVIDTTAPTSELRATHFASDLTDARRDVNVVFPVDPLKAAVQAGEVGALSRNAYAFMGGIYSSRRVEEQLAPAIADRIESDEVDLALLVPV
jgi:D-proline reductase (dithiol) PrdB